MSKKGEEKRGDSSDTVGVDQDKPAEDERTNDKGGNMRRLAEDVLMHSAMFAAQLRV
jgi:hypothetical protein